MPGWGSTTTRSSQPGLSERAVQWFGECLALARYEEIVTLEDLGIERVRIGDDY